MKIGIVILCRYSSKRLPGKILKEIKGRSVLGHIVDRIKRATIFHQIVVATSTDTSDDHIFNYCYRSNLNCFRGSLENVSERFLSCAEKYDWDFVVRINGDNLFTDPDTLHSMLAIAETGSYDLVTNVPGRTFPYGMSIEILRVAFYREVIAQFKSKPDYEHVTSWLYENGQVGLRYTFRNNNLPDAAGLQMALDDPQDLLFSIDIFNKMEYAPATYNIAMLLQIITRSDSLSPWVGEYGPLLIAEIGGNHEGNFDVARSMVEQAIETNVDYIKFQLYRGDTLVSSMESPDRNKHFKKFELSREQHVELACMCQNAGVGYMASVWDLEMLEWIDPYISVYKIGSGDLTAWSMISEFARRGKPIILSTGLATLDEVLQAVAKIQVIDEKYKLPEWLCLLQCTSMYPIEENEANLRVMETLRDATGLTVGYSDHTMGQCALRTAAAMGAKVLEFHFTDNREGKVFRDHKVSLIPKEVCELQKELLTITNLRGNTEKIPQKTEIDQDHVTSFRRAVYVCNEIKAGQLIKSEDLVTLRPNLGIDARDEELIVGSKARHRLKPYEKLNWDDLYKSKIENYQEIN